MPTCRATVTRSTFGEWQIRCPRCILLGGYVGEYSDHEAALSNAAAHMRRGVHRMAEGSAW